MNRPVLVVEVAPAGPVPAARAKRSPTGAKTSASKQPAIRILGAHRIPHGCKRCV
jgi:hypothetical protein